MLKKTKNKIWERAIGDSNKIRNNTVKAITLEKAAKIVMVSNDEKFAFRRNKELVDFKGKFRSFNFRNKDYVIKIFKGNRIPKEYINAIKANKLLISNKRFYVPIPNLIYFNNSVGLVYPDFGYTLHEDLVKTKSIPLENIVCWFKDLLSHGIEWAGFLPRNIIQENHKIILIDWEDAIFNNNTKLSISDLTLFKMVLGWSQVYGSISEVKKSFEKCLNNRIYVSCKDNFEIAYGNLVNVYNIDTIRAEAIELSLKSEGPSLNDLKTNLSFMDVGHIVDDLFDINISVLYTCCTASIREKNGDVYFSSFCIAFETILCLGLKENNEGTISLSLDNIRNIILLFLLYFFQEPSLDELNYLENLKSIIELNNFLETSNSISSHIIKFMLCKENGLNNAIYRSSYMHKFLYELFGILKKYLIKNNSIHLLLRGSCAQGLMTTKSDVDFEVSGILFPYGQIFIEGLISNILNIFGINNEGSWGRPKEEDIYIGEYTRDYHEWTELTCPNVNKYDKGWLNNKKATDFSWQKWSIYEKHHNYISSKYIFFKARALLMRLVIKNNIQFIQYADQIIELEKILRFDLVSNIKNIIEESLELYENDEINIEKMLMLNDRIDKVYELADIKMYY